MAQVMLINPPMWSPRDHATFNALCPPLGLGYLAACLLQEGFSVCILDLNVTPRPDEALKAALIEDEPRLVGITALTQNYFLAQEVARTVKAVWNDAFVVLGGPHASYLYEETLAEPVVDAVVLFEGEQTIVDLTRKLEKKTPDLGDVAGLAFRRGEQVVLTKSRPHEKHLDRLPFPARHLLPMAQYGRPGTIMTSRGCPEKCIFCISSTYEGAYRMRGAANVVEELSTLRNTWGIREIYFIDNVFTVNAQRVRDICQQIIDRRLDIQFHCVSRANLVTEEVISWLKAAGCQRIEIGVESGSQSLIDAYQKHITLDQVYRAADIVLGAGLRPMYTFQIGSPFETEASLEATHNLAAELRAKGAITFFSIMTPYPGTPLALKAQEFGIQIQARDWREYRTSNPVYDARQLDRNQFRQALYREVAMGFEPGAMPYSAQPIYP